jgi:hypothetical protein
MACNCINNIEEKLKTQYGETACVNKGYMNDGTIRAIVEGLYHKTKRNGDFGKCYRHWHIDGKMYKTKEKFIAALADFNPNVLPINHRPYQNTVARMKHEQEARPKATFVDMPKR